ncbi:glutamate-5-semialdehyde dehydrogenase [Angustibacter luteus]|uniref:Gamma-glutamyl phosphate reductase n=1 Tax=Angustibacter luteus TaxID=658456 RepID=A0ABW1JK72_9ACTN
MDVLAACRNAKLASRAVRPLTRADKDALLLAMADALVDQTAVIVRANDEDVARGRAEGLSEGLVDRLRLDDDRVAAVAQALRDLAALPDPVGEVVRGERLANGLEVRQTRVPMGVVAMVYEARPNVTVDAAGLALKSGNAVVLRGGSAAAQSNAALVAVLRSVLSDAGLPPDAVTLIDGGGREAVKHLMTARGLVDVLIPRGGAELIRTVVEGSTVPVIETGVGNCHVYVDAAADLERALAIALNSKTHRPSVCNAAETLLVHESVAGSFLAAAIPALDAAGVTLHGDSQTVRAGLAAGIDVVAADDEDWAREYLSLDLAVRVVESLDDAIAHIDRWSSGHTEAIVTDDLTASRRFVAAVDSAAVMVNASTRFTDGGQLGLGAEIGISTQKLHARGPMGLAELTTTTWVVTGEGHVRD